LLQNKELYKVDTLGKFLFYNSKLDEFKNDIPIVFVKNQLKTFDDKIEDDQFNCNELEMENFIAECIMINRKKCYRSSIR